MQLRVARLCLDCEELHTENSCPRCASESYAYLRHWLPVEERRKWRRPAPSTATASGPWWAQTPSAIMKAIVRWLDGESPAEPPAQGPMTRAADFAAQIDFEAAEQQKARKDLPLPLPKPRARKV